MSEFDAFFDDALASKRNTKLLANLGILVYDHLLRFENDEPLGMHDKAMDDFKTFSVSPFAVGGGASFRIDRTTSDVMEAHGVDTGVFLDHVADKAVVDIGPGISPFLDDCQAGGSSRTVALDINKRVLEIARFNGHEAYEMAGHNLPLEPNSVDVIHSSYAVPFTSRPDEALSLAGACVAALKVDGYGLINPVVPPRTHELFEQLIARANPLEASVEEATALPFARSLALTAFCARLLDSRDTGEVDVIVFRHISQGSLPGASGKKRIELPSSVIFRKAA